MKKKILLIEDNLPDVMILRMALDKAGEACEITTIGDGAEAVRFVREQDTDRASPLPDIILLDLNIPGRDGLEILREIRGSSGLATVPVVILSSTQSPRDTEAILRLEPAAFLHKPLDFDGVLELGKTIKRFFERGFLAALAVAAGAWQPVAES